MRTLYALVVTFAASALVGCAGSGNATPLRGQGGFASTPEALCVRVPDPLELRVCRAEARFRITRRQGTAAEVECASDHLDQMHAALRERTLTIEHHMTLDNLPGYEPDEEARIRRTGRTIMQLWDELQAGVCNAPATPNAPVQSVTRHPSAL